MEESEPVWLRDPQGQSCQLSILMFPKCPIYLLGRDGLLLLGLALIPISQNQIVVKRKAELQQGDFFLLKGTGQPYYYYSFVFPNKPPHKTATALMTEGRNAISKPQDQMSDDNLYVTLWYKNTPRPDKDYDDKLTRATPTRVTVNYIYADAKSIPVAGVTLPTNLQILDRVWFPPHISLCKGTDLTWKDLDKIVQQGENADN